MISLSNSIISGAIVIILVFKRCADTVSTLLVQSAIRISPNCVCDQTVVFPVLYQRGVLVSILFLFNHKQDSAIDDIPINPDVCIERISGNL